MKVTPEITLIATQDDISVRGNAMCSDDPEFDRKVEDEILARLDDGDVWAWASVEIRATYKGLSASAYLGCCCYTDEADFRADAYYQDLVAEACEQLRALVADVQGVEIMIPSDGTTCPQCGHRYEQGDTDGGRCLSCGTMIAAE